MKKALILVDFENEWLDENSDYYIGDITNIINKTNKLIDYAREEDYKIIFIRHVEEGSDKEFAPNSNNVQIIDKLNKNEDDILITKYRISAFYKTNLEEELVGVDEIVVCGVLTNLCVRSLIHDAYDRDFEIKVIKDCCCAFDDDTQNFTFKDLKNTRPEIEFLDLDELLKHK